jgi:hypothetical protein
MFEYVQYPHPVVILALLAGGSRGIPNTAYRIPDQTKPWVTVNSTLDNHRVAAMDESTTTVKPPTTDNAQFPNEKSLTQD